MQVIVNGEERELPGRATVQSAVELTGVPSDARGVAAALDGEVVPRSSWETTSLSEGARIEVLQAVQGG